MPDPHRRALAQSAARYMAQPDSLRWARGTAADGAGRLCDLLGRAQLPIDDNITADFTLEQMPDQDG